MPVFNLFRSAARTRTPEFLRHPIMVSFLVSFLNALVVLVLYFNLQPVIPLFYSLARPVDQLTSKEWLFLLPAISFLISIVHTTLLRAMANTDQLLLKIFAWTTVGFQIMLSLSLVRIIMIVI